MVAEVLSSTQVKKICTPHPTLAAKVLSNTQVKKKSCTPHPTMVASGVMRVKVKMFLYPFSSLLKRIVIAHHKEPTSESS